MKIGNNNINDFKVGSGLVDSIYLGQTLVWLKAPAVQYFSIDNGPTANTITLTKTGSPTATLQYSLNGGRNWSNFIIDLGVSLPANASMKVKGNNTLLATSSSNYLKFTSTLNFSISGKLNTLLFGDNPDLNMSGSYNFTRLFNGCTYLTSAADLILANNTTERCYQYMFNGCTSLENAPELSATLAAYCYENMFYGCTSLVSAPELPVTTLAIDCYKDMLRGCTSLVTAPELPATTLASSCYDSMFYGCSSLTAAPELPATTLASSCYDSMFNGCTSLVTAPELPATTLSDSCYNSMFYRCTSLVTAPELPATTLSNYCYQSMFSQCSSLVNAPELPATTLAKSCYQNMFMYCSSLSSAPELSATTLAERCYFQMFSNCTALVNAPALPATTLANECYRVMFSGCSSLTYVKHNIVNWNESYTTNWLQNVAATGIVECPEGSTIPENSASGIPTGWTKKLPTQYFSIDNGSTANTITLAKSGSPVATFQYSLDGGWKWSNLIIDLGISLPANASMKVKGNILIVETSRFFVFTSTLNFSISGKLNTLLYGDNPDLDISGIYNFFNLFNGCTHLTDISNLVWPNNTTNSCYKQMFLNCTSLTSVPELPATTLANNCYYGMFWGCTSLVTAHELPATTLADSCYKSMFYNCTSLVNAPELPATTLTDSCYHTMFYGCRHLNYVKHNVVNWNESYTSNWLRNVASSGIVDCPEGCTIPENSYAGVPTGWTKRVPVLWTGLTFTAQQANSTVGYIPTTATTASYSTDGSTWQTLDNQTVTLANVGDKIYVKGKVLAAQSQNNCSRFTMSGQITASGSIMSLYNENPDDTTISTQLAFGRLFIGCSALTSAPELPATTLANYCYYGMFYGCSGLTAAPALPAMSLANSCYDMMFYNCSSLTAAPALPATTLAGYCYEFMFQSCSGLTAAPALPATTLADHCYYYMFSSCSSLLTAPALPATTLANNCYELMFYNCSSLTAAPTILPATTLTNSCYKDMFWGCSSLTAAPELPATALVDSCYKNTFTACSSLSSVTINVTNWNTAYAEDWLYNTAATGIVNCPEGCTIPENSDSGVPTGWTKRVPIQYFSIDNGSTANTITLTKSGSPTATLQYSLDNGSTWTNFTINSGVSLPANASMKVKGNNTLLATNDSNYLKFTSTLNFSISGKLNTLLFSDNPDLNMSGSYNFYDLFNGCTHLTSAADLIWPNNTTNYCYSGMFLNCSNLLNVNQLSAVSMSESCYRVMFLGCTKLVTAPEISATTLAENCFRGMFLECTSLISGPSKINATALSSYSCRSMFYGCTSLKNAPELPATTLAANCYEYMFSSCQNLSTPPELPATTLAANCYNVMFWACRNLTIAPELPATTLANNCYSSMFEGCAKINYIKHNVVNWNTSYTTNWLLSVASSGIVDCPEGSTIPENSASGVPTGWTKRVPQPMPNYLTFTAVDDEVEISYTPTSVTSALYSFNGEDWTYFVEGLPLTLMPDEKIYLVGSVIGDLTSSNYAQFSMSSEYGKIEIAGSLMSLYNGDPEEDTIEYEYALAGLFRECTPVITPPELPATTLYKGCYYGLFNRCSNLTIAPELPAGVGGEGVMAEECYRSMFAYCSSLTEAPELLSFNPRNSCYLAMFNGCTSLLRAPELPISVSVSSMYNLMFRGCTSLIETQEIHIETLSAPNCFTQMFSGCTSLTSVNIDTYYWNQNYASNWLQNVSQYGTIECPADSDIASYPGNSGVPNGWIVEYKEADDGPAHPGHPDPGSAL